MTSPQTKAQPSLMSITNARIKANAEPGSNAYSGWLAGIRAGITPAGETTAITQAGPYLSDLRSSRQRSAAMRAAAIRAINKDVHYQALKVGSALALLNAKEPSASIEAQVSVLPLMTVDAAALVLDGLVGRLAGPNIGVDFFDLEDTLVYWGTGANRNPRRTQIVMDFYQYQTSKPSNTLNT